MKILGITLVHYPIYTKPLLTRYFDYDPNFGLTDFQWWIISNIIMFIIYWFYKLHLKRVYKNIFREGISVNEQIFELMLYFNQVAGFNFVFKISLIVMNLCFLFFYFNLV